ncbi:MAG: DUF4199 domain-containing protein [Bacteroidota bacterium]
MSLDDSREFIDEKSVSMWNTVLTYGVIGGILLVIYSYFDYTSLFSTSSLGAMIGSFLINLAIFGGIVFLAIRKHRDQELGGYITMGRCLGVGILTVVVASVLSGIFGYLYMSFVDPEVMTKMTQNMTWMYEMMGVDEDQIEDTLEATADLQQSPNILTSVGGGAFGGALYGLILSAIIGAVMRKNPPEMA